MYCCSAKSGSGGKLDGERGGSVATDVLEPVAGDEEWYPSTHVRNARSAYRRQMSENAQVGLSMGVCHWLCVGEGHAMDMGVFLESTGVICVHVYICIDVNAAQGVCLCVMGMCVRRCV